MILQAPYTENADLNSFLADVASSVSTSNSGVTLDANTGRIYDSATGTVLSYLYRYMHVQYANDNIGTGMSSSPTGKTYYGIWNSNSLTPSTNPADYTWFLTSGFGTTYLLYDKVTGGRQIQFSVSNTAVSGMVVAASPIDLDAVTVSIGSTAVVATVFAYKIVTQGSSSPTFTTPTTGNAVPSGWSSTAGVPAAGQVLYYLTGKYNPTGATLDGVPANSTAWSGPISITTFQDIMSDNWNGSVPPTFATPATWGTTGWYLRRDTGTIIANQIGARGTLQAGTAAISGTTMTGSGGVINDTGTFAFGNSTGNVTFNGTTLTINGPVVATGNLAANAVSNVVAWALPSGVVGYTPGYSSIGSLDLSSFGTNPCVIMFTGYASMYWDDSTSTVYTGSQCDTSFKAQQGSSATLVTVSASCATGGTYAPGFVNITCSLYVANPSAGVIDLSVATNIRGSTPGGGSASTYLKTNFIPGALATIICLKR